MRGYNVSVMQKHIDWGKLTKLAKMSCLPLREFQDDSLADVALDLLCFYQRFPLHTVYTRSCLSWHQTWNWPIYLLFFFSQLLPFHYSLNQIDTQRMQDDVVYCTSRVARWISTLVFKCACAFYRATHQDSFWLDLFHTSLTHIFVSFLLVNENVNIF